MLWCASFNDNLPRRAPISCFHLSIVFFKLLMDFFMTLSLAFLATISHASLVWSHRSTPSLMCFSSSLPLAHAKVIEPFLGLISGPFYLISPFLLPSTQRLFKERTLLKTRQISYQSHLFSSLANQSLAHNQLNWVLELSFRFVISIWASSMT